MTLLEIFNIALGEHGKTITQADFDNEIWEVKLCKNNYRASVLNVLGEFDWNFLTTKVFIDYSYDCPSRKWAHGYLLPQGILRIVPRSSQPYEVVRNIFYTNESCPEIYAIMDNFECENSRDDICYLVAYNLSFQLCSNLSPNNQNIQSTILQKYNMMLTTMVDAQSNSYIRSVEEGGIVEHNPIPEFRAHSNGNHHIEITDIDYTFPDLDTIQQYRRFGLEMPRPYPTDEE